MLEKLVLYVWVAMFVIPGAVKFFALCAVAICAIGGVCSLFRDKNCVVVAITRRCNLDGSYDLKCNIKRFDERGSEVGYDSFSRICAPSAEVEIFINDCVAKGREMALRCNVEMLYREEKTSELSDVVNKAVSDVNWNNAINSSIDRYARERQQVNNVVTYISN